MKKLNLLIDEPFAVCALSSAEQTYRLVWLLNDALKISLKRNEKEDVVLDEGEESRVYPLFRFYDEESHIHICLLANKSKNVPFFPKYKTVDYFLKLSGLLTDSKVNEIVSSVKNINEIMACIKLETSDKKMVNFFEHL